MGVTGRVPTLLLAAGILITPSVLASSWLMVVDSGVLAADRADADRLLARVATAPGIHVLTLRDVDTGWLTFLATASDETGGEAHFDDLRQALAGQVADGAALGVWQLKVDPERSCQPSGPGFVAAPPYYRYALFAVTGDGDAVDRLLERRAALCRMQLQAGTRGYTGYTVLRGSGPETPDVIALATAASVPAALDEPALGRRERAVMRRLARQWQPLTVIGGEWQRDLGVRVLAAGPPPGAPPQTRVAPREPLPPAPLPTEVATVEPLPPIAPEETATDTAAEMAAEMAAEKTAPAAAAPATPRLVVESEQLAAAVHRWAEAWTAQRVDDYLAAYATSFVPPAGRSRAAWAAQRRQRLTAPRWIDVDIDGVVAGLESPERGWVEFVQRYRSDSYQDTVTKRLELVREDGTWKIAGETVLDGG